MASLDSTIKNQLPESAMKSGDSKTAAGVIDENLYSETDVLANQARAMARARSGIPYENGDEFSDRFTRAVREHNLPKQYVNQRLSEETLNQIMQGSQNRDQQWVGNNADWTGYYLEPLAKFVVPFDTPFRNMLPRTPSVGIDIENWRAITDVFGGTGPSVGAFILPQQIAPQKASYNWVNKSNLLRQLSFSDVVTMESELYGRMFEPDVRAKVASKLAPSLMLGQEVWYLNAAQQLWAPPPPNTPTTNTSGGSLAATTTYWVIVTAVTGSYASNVFTQTGESAAFGGLTPTAASVTTGAGSTNTISFNIMRVPNAIRYNVYVGSGSTQPSNSNMNLADWNADFAPGSVHALDDPGGLASGYFNVTLTTIPSPSGSTTPATVGMHYSNTISGSGAPLNAPTVFPSGNYSGTGVASTTPLTFDGIQSLIYNNTGTLSTVGVGGETATVKTVKDTGGALAKSDIDGWLESMYLNARANPECLLVSVKDHKAISNLITTNTNYRVNVQPTSSAQSDLVGGGRATKWINQTTGRLMDIIMVPYLMQGTMIAVSLTLPFQVAEIDKPPLRISVNRELWALEYPPDQSHMTQWSYAAFTSETMVSQFLGGQGILQGIVTA